MSFLQIDGLTMSVPNDYPKQTYEEVGSREFAFNGGRLCGVRAVKRAWEVKLNRMPEADAEALIHLLRGDGVYFPFNGVPYSSAGYVPVTASDLIYPSGLAAADPTSVSHYPTDDVPFGHYLGGRSLSMATPTTNLLTADEASFDAGLGSWSATYATLTRDTTVSIDAGSASAKSIKTGDDPQNARVFTTPLSVGQYVTFSVYVRTAVSRSIMLLIFDYTLANNGEAVTVAVAAGKWTRIAVTMPVLAATSSWGVYINQEGTSTEPIWFDKAQVELSAEMTEWVAGGASRATHGELQLSNATRSPFVGWDGAWSFNCWVRGRQSVPKYLLGVFYSSGAWIDVVSADTWGYMSRSGHVAAGALPAANEWVMITAVVAAISDGSARFEFWVDGVLVGTSTVSVGVSDIVIGDAVQVSIGGNGPGSVFAGNIAHAFFVPCRLTQRWIQALYNDGDGALFGMWPKHRITGDITSGRPALDALIQVKGSDPVEYYDNGAWVNNGREVTFTMLEV